VAADDTPLPDSHTSIALWFCPTMLPEFVRVRLRACLVGEVLSIALSTGGFNFPHKSVTPRPCQDGVSFGGFVGVVDSLVVVGFGCTSSSRYALAFAPLHIPGSIEYPYGALTGERPSVLLTRIFLPACGSRTPRIGQSCRLGLDGGASAVHISSGAGIQSVAASPKEASLDILSHRIAHSCLTSTLSPSCEFEPVP